MYDISKNDGTFPMHWAARLGDLAEIKRIAKENPQALREGNEDEELPHHWAAISGSFEVLKWIVSQDETLLDRSIGHGESCLHLAAREGHVEMMKWIISKRPHQIYSENSHGTLPIHSAAYGGIEAVQYLVSLDPILLTCRGDYNLACPIHFAAYVGDLEMIQWMVEQDSTLLSKRTNYWNLPIHCAASAGKIEVVQWMIAQNESFLFELNKEGNLPIHEAAMRKHWETVVWIAERSPGLLMRHGHFAVTPFIEDGPLKKTPLDLLCEADQDEMLDALFNKSSLCQNVRDYNENLPIHVILGAQSEKFLELAKSLLSQNPAHLWQRNMKGELPIHLHVPFWAALGLTGWILDQDIKLLSETDREENSVLHLLCNEKLEGKRFECIQRILREMPELLTQPNKYGELPIHLATQSGDLNCVKYFLKLDPALLYAQDTYGRVSLHYVQDLELCKWMVSQDETLLWHETPYKSIPLHSLFDHEAPIETIKWMIEKDPKLLEVKNLVGRNFSEMAEDFEETEILEYLNQRRS